MFERHRWFGIFLAKAVLVCGCAPLALYGQSNPTATWTGGGNDSSWNNGKNWQWDNTQCNDPNSGIAVPPATFINPSSPCYYANVMIPGGVTVNEDEDANSYIVNFTLGASALNGAAGATGNVTIASGAILYGNASAAGNVTIGPGAIVDGNAAAGVPSSTSGVLTNQGTIYGSVLGGTVINQKGGIIQPDVAAAVVLATTQGTNQGLIEALNAGGGPHLTATGALSLTGPWNNAGGTIQIDNGAVLTCDATITGGSLINDGGSIGGAGNGLTIAGTVNSTSLTIDNPGGPTTVTITGTLNNTDGFILGQTSSVSTVMVNGGKLNVIGGDTTLGVNSGATGQLEISGTGVVTTTTGNLTIGVSGTGYVSVASGGAFTVSGGSTTLGAQAGSSGQLQIFGASALPTTTGNLVIGAAGTGSVTVGNGVLTAGVITLGSASSGSGQLTVGGTVNYASINILHGAKPAVSVNSGGNLASIPQKTAASDSLVASAVVAGANSTWTTQNRLVVQGGGSLTILNGGAMNVTCSSCPALANYGTNWYLTDAFQVSGDSTVDVTGSGANLSVKPNSGVGPGATLTVENASTASLGNFLLKGKTTVQGMGSVLNPPSGSTATTITGISSGGVLIVQNEGAFRSDRMLLYGQNPQLVVQDVGEVVLGSLSPASDPALEVHSGGVLIQSNAAVLIQNDAVIGGGNSPAMVTVTGAALQGGMLQSESITIKPYGTLQIAGADIVSLGPASTINFVPGTPPGKIDVSHGELSIGKVSTDADLTVGWLNVFPGGTLLGGQDCPGIDPFCKLINGAGDLILDGSVDNQGGTIRLDPTTLSVTQNFQQSSGTLGLQMDGAGAGQYDQITAGGSIQITGGTVEFDFANGFAPHSGDKFNVLSASAALSVSGANFTTTGLASGFNYTTSINSGQFDLNATNSGTATTSAPAPPPTPTLTSSDSASGATELAPGSLASGYGTGLATGQPASATYIWPTAIGGTSVSIVDFDGATTQAPLLYVSSTEVDYQIPDTVALGPATVTVTAGNGTTKLGPVNVVPYAPGIFEVNTAGLSASFADCVASDGTQTTILTSQVVNGALVAVPLNLKACQETVLELWTTGLDEADASLVQATIGGKGATVLYAGPQGVYPGVDQVNVVIPQSLAGAGNVPVVVSTEGVTSNTVNVTIQ